MLELQRILQTAERLEFVVAKQMTEARRRQRVARLRPVEEQMTQQLAMAFRKQKNMLLGEMRKLKERPADQWNWDAIFARVTLETQSDFRQVVEQGVRRALAIGAAVAGRRLRVPVAIVEQADFFISFDLNNPWAWEYLLEHGAALISQIDEGTRSAIQSILLEAAQEGWSYNETAKKIIQEYEEMAIGKPQEHIDSRAHFIVVTELGNAFAEAQMRIAEKLKNAGIAVEKYWDTMKDDRVSDGCAANEGVGWIELDEYFPSGHQRPLRFPGCRCDILTRRQP